MIASRLSLRFRKSYHPIRPTYLHHHHQHQHYHHGRRHRSVVGEEAEAAAAGATAVVAVEEEPSSSKPTPVPERWTGFYRAGPNISFIRPHCDLSVSPRSPGDVFSPSWRRQPALLSFVRSTFLFSAVSFVCLIFFLAQILEAFLGLIRGLTSFGAGYSLRVAKVKKAAFDDEASQRAVTTALWCNFLVFSLKFGVWLSTSSHVMLAEMVHSIADFANQALLAYGLNSSRRAPDALHPYGYSKERFVWSLISAVGIFCLGSGATVVHGVQNLWSTAPPENMQYAALVIGGSFLIEGASLLVAVNAVRKCAAAEGMKVRDYIWRGHDPTSVAVMTEDGAAVTGLAIAAASLIAVKITGNAMYDPIGSIIVGNLLGMVAIFLIQRNRHALIGRAIDDHDMKKVLEFLRSDPVVHSLYDCKSEVIGPGFFRFKAEIDFNGVAVVQNYLERAGREEWASKFREAASNKEDAALLKTMACYGEELVEALGSEVDRLETEIQKIVPGIRHVDIEAHDPTSTSP